MKTISKVPLILYSGAVLWAFAIATVPGGSLFENDDVKVARALEKPHVKGSFHEHKPNRVMVYLQDGRQNFEYQDGRKPATFDWKEGQVVWSPAEGMHSPEVVSDQPFNIIEVELKKPAGEKVKAPALDALKVDAKQYKLEFENGQTRVLRLKLAPHQSTPLIDHDRNSVAVFLADEEVRVTDSKGAAVTEKHKAGDAVWQTPATQKIENTGTAPLEMVLIEVRG